MPYINYMLLTSVYSNSSLLCTLLAEAAHCYKHGRASDLGSTGELDEINVHLFWRYIYIF